MIACATPAVAVTPEEFDARPELLNCRNGTLELDTLDVPGGAARGPAHEVLRGGLRSCGRVPDLARAPGPSVRGRRGIHPRIPGALWVFTTPGEP